MKQDYFTDKVVAITGSSRGIGRTLAITLAERGACLAINGRSEDSLKRTEDDIRTKDARVIAVRGDVGVAQESRALIEACVKEFGRMDVLINNAGISLRGAFEKILPDVFKKVTEVNILGSIYPTMHSLPYLKETKGSVVFISSLAGLHGIPGVTAYCASKMALTAVAESLRAEMSPYGMHVGIMYLGFTENDEEKRILSPEGEWIAISHAYRYHNTQEKAARLILKKIAGRKFKSVFTPAGKLLAFVQRLWPGILDSVFTLSQKRMKHTK